MPTYQYACTACGEQHEAVQSFTDAPLTDCPTCDGRLRKVFSAVGVVFKGSGFYKTDSRGSAAKPKEAAASSGDGGKGASGGKGDGGTSGASESSTAKKDSSAPVSSGSSSSGVSGSSSSGSAA